MTNPNSRDRQKRHQLAPFLQWALLGLLSACTQNGPSDKTGSHVVAGCEFLEPREEEPECGGLAERCAQVQGETREREFVLTLDDTGLSTKELERRTACLTDSLELAGTGVQESRTRAGSVVVHGTWEELRYFVHAQALLAFDVRCDAEGALCRDCDGRREEECVADAYCQVIRGARIDLERACLGEQSFLVCASQDTCDDATLVGMNEDGEAFYTECDELAGYEYSYDEVPPSASCADEVGEETDAGGSAGP